VILIDLNVILDVLQRRMPHYPESARVVDHVVRRRVTAALSAHSVTTLHYLTTKFAGRRHADEVVEWAMRHFEIAPVGPEQLHRAKSLAWPDYEDAVVAATAESAGCTTIVTRNAKDFRDSPVPALTPEELVINEVHERLVAGYG
jgi:predicted nucleic acid-binding protein